MTNDLLSGTMNRLQDHFDHHVIADMQRSVSWVTLGKQRVVHQQDALDRRVKRSMAKGVPYSHRRKTDPEVSLTPPQ